MSTIDPAGLSEPAATLTLDPQVVGFAAAVRAEFDDLTAEQRDDLLEDLDGHLAEVAADADGVGTLVDRLGQPQAYADELRRSAGLAPRPLAASAAGGLLGRTLAGLAISGPVRRLERAWLGLNDRPWGRRTVVYLRELRPGWWLVRAVAIVTAVALVTSSGIDLIPHLFGSSAIGLLALMAAIPASIGLGRRTVARDGAARRWVVTTVNVAGVIALVMLATEVGDERIVSIDQAEYDQIGFDGAGYGGGTGTLYGASGQPITNLYPYSADGQALDGVLLYDQDGRPVTNLSEWDDRGRTFENEYRLGPDGQPIVNQFPRSQQVYDESDGSRRPNARPGVALPIDPNAATTAPEPTSLPATSQPAPTTSKPAPTTKPAPATTKPAPPTTAPPTTG